MKFSEDGSLLATVTAFGSMEVFRFDRCTGLLSDWLPITYPRPCSTGLQPNSALMSCAISPENNFLYASALGPNYQVRISPASTSDSVHMIYESPHSNATTNGMQLGPDGKIYVSVYGGTNALDSLKTHMSVIHEPDQPGAACDFRPFSFSLLGKEGRGIIYNLNYNVGPVPTYRADAGKNTTICQGDSTLLGIDTILPTIHYQWQTTTGWQSTSPQPTVSPDTTTTYYLSITDTASNITYSCNIRQDTVTVTVLQAPPTTIIDTAVAEGSVYLGTTITTNDTLFENYTAVNGCDSLVEHRVQVISAIEHVAPTHTIELLPNPAGTTFTINFKSQDLTSCTIFGIDGQVVFNLSKIPQDFLTVDVNWWHSGLYFVRLVAGPDVFIEKIVVR